MGFGQVFVFAGEVCDVVPEFLVEMAFYSVSNALRLSNIYGTLSSFWVNSCEKVHARIL